MLTSTYVNLKSFFYPIGNTSAANLLRDYRPCGKKPVEILAIGCGDVRNILFTLWSNPDSRKIGCNFTVCDLDPAVLARNIFLLSIVHQHASEIAAGESKSLLLRLWRLYYHFYVTTEDLAFAQDHAEMLHAASESLSTWKESPIGQLLQFSTEASLSEVRRIWYLHAQDRTTQEDAQTRKVIKSMYDVKSNTKDGPITIIHGTRSAGTHGLMAAPPLNVAFHDFWKTGVVAGNNEDVSALGRDGGGRVNPLMSVSPIASKNFDVHYGSDPLIGFHLAEAFDLSTAANAESLARLGSSTLPSFTHHYTRPWSAVRLNLPSTLATKFDVIDISNVIDHVSLLNIMPATVPLLSNASASVLYTESLLQGGKEPEKLLATLLHSDVSTSSLLFCIAPVGHLLGTTTDSSHIEQLLEVSSRSHEEGRQRQFRVRILWRLATQGDCFVTSSTSFHACRLQMDPQELASFFMQTYLAMFREAEDIGIRLKVMRRKLTTPLLGDIGFYSRVSLVTLLSTARRTFSTDWKTCISALLNMIETDRSLIVSSNSLQELYLHLHAAGLFSVETLEEDPRARPNPWGKMRPPGESGLLGRHSVPPIVHVALIVSRRSLSVFTDQAVDRVGTPGLRLSVHNGMKFENCFFAIDTFFGSFERGSDDGGSRIIEDHAGWTGDADLIVTCAVPTWPLLLDRRQDLNVSLVVNTSPATAQYTQKLGFTMRVFTANLDSKRVRILVQPPSTESGAVFDIRPASAVAFTTPDSATVSLQTDGTVQSIRVTRSFATDSEESKTLKSGGAVEVSQISPCALDVSIGDLHNSSRFVFSFPINGAARKVKIARKSSWIEVQAPISTALQLGGHGLNPFPVIESGETMLAWATSQDLEVNFKNSYASRRNGFQRAITHSSQDQPRPQYHAINDSAQRSNSPIVSRIQWPAPRFPGSKDPALHHTGSVFLDAFFMPASLELITQRSFAKMMGSNSDNKSLVIGASKEDAQLWHHLIPSLAECCRSWEHTSTCLYKISSTRPFAEFTCGCGMGKDIAKLPHGFKDVAAFATRVAIPFISAVPYVESIRDEEVMNAFAELGLENKKSDACGSCGDVKAGMKVCGRCEKVKYCNHACQKAAWKVHKKECKR
ncbi:hypothetical protein AUEXF2481DRAFT_25498 [Aureobasidium subglaciale EXF-2481]|uniref:MYND-type domain-containing protein n=1 Tax=Aureobasidium subglaciale (strain EXF-2481) TaxID=1043005 RepID=A0A074ZMP7_AURSE|nr:uncharacterized protein AUEXF2481DRAFT_25498 [Aureobasidium subglaciale EXF-2481]KEQ99606.1 hypothetical protein AUEXF2481DRAFT_25498 [Aureobasidium subglaciale EXF-2481]